MLGGHVNIGLLDMMCYVIERERPLKKWLGAISVDHQPAPSSHVPAGLTLLPGSSLEDSIIPAVHFFGAGNGTIVIDIFHGSVISNQIVIGLEAQLDPLRRVVVLQREVGVKR